MHQECGPSIKAHNLYFCRGDVWSHWIRFLPMDETQAWKLNKGNFDKTMSLSQESLTGLKWWIDTLPSAHNLTVYPMRTLKFITTTYTSLMELGCSLGISLLEEIGFQKKLNMQLCSNAGCFAYLEILLKCNLCTDPHYQPHNRTLMSPKPPKQIESKPTFSRKWPLDCPIPLQAIQ